MADQQPPPPPPPPGGYGGYGGPGYYAQQPPPKRRGGCGKAALIALAVLGALFVVAIIAAIVGGGDGDGDTATEDTSGTTAAPEATAAPDETEAPGGPPNPEGEPDEIDDVVLDSCENDPTVGLAVARGTIANNSSEASTYLIELNIVDAAGTVIGNTLATVANVPADGNANWEAPSTVELPEGGSCVLTSVDRVAA